MCCAYIYNSSKSTRGANSIILSQPTYETTKQMYESQRNRRVHMHVSFKMKTSFRVRTVATVATATAPQTIKPKHTHTRKQRRLHCSTTKEYSLFCCCSFAIAFRSSFGTANRFYFIMLILIFIRTQAKPCARNTNFIDRWRWWPRWPTSNDATADICSHRTIGR